MNTDSKSPLMGNKIANHNDSDDLRCRGITRAGTRCRQQALSGSHYCSYHAPAIETVAEVNEDKGRYSGYAGGLESNYQAALQDRYLLHLRDEIAILDARVKDLLRQTQDGVNAAAWKKFTNQYRILKNALKNNDFKALNAILETMDEGMEEGRRENDLWTDIQSAMEQRRRLVETEQKYLTQTNQMIPIESAITLLSAIITSMRNSLKKYVANHEIEQVIVVDAQREYERIIGA